MFCGTPRRSMPNDFTRLCRLAECDLTQRPEDAVQDLRQLAVTVMHLGSLEDWAELVDILGEDFLRQTLRESPGLLFTEKVWDYWHLRLNPHGTPVPPCPRGLGRHLG